MRIDAAKSQSKRTQLQIKNRPLRFFGEEGIFYGASCAAMRAGKVPVPFPTVSR